MSKRAKFCIKILSRSEKSAKILGATFCRTLYYANLHVLVCPLNSMTCSHHSCICRNWRIQNVYEINMLQYTCFLQQQDKDANLEITIGNLVTCSLHCGWCAGYCWIRQWSWSCTTSQFISAMLHWAGHYWYNRTLSHFVSIIYATGPCFWMYHCFILFLGISPYLYMPVQRWA